MTRDDAWEPWVLAEADLQRFFRVTPRVVHQMIKTLAARRFIESAAHVATDGEYEFMREAGMFDDDVISGAAAAIWFERARALLLGGARASQ